ncbi:DUF6879 family protein [Nonomuraea candida]|uniref:DUF6879 family protein n=1 Tax=Nonomuraea candida TaxID=359159 RepID=UPI0006934AC7|nr:DUF6879 family protein [Nonomuraea candida]
MESISPRGRDNYGSDAELSANWQAGGRKEVPRVLRPWCDRVSLPGNDFWLLDGEMVVFDVFDGMDQRAEIPLGRDPVIVKYRADAFSALWESAIPHRDHCPA